MLYLQGLIEGMKGSSKPLVFSHSRRSVAAAARVHGARARASHHPVALGRSQPAGDGQRHLLWPCRRAGALRGGGDTVHRAAEARQRRASRNGSASRCSRPPAFGFRKARSQARRTRRCGRPRRIGYPVAMKAQAGTLAHKTEAGAVMLNVADEAGVRRAWQALHGQRATGAAGDRARRRAGRADGGEGARARRRRQTRSALGAGRAGRARRHLGRGARRRAPAATGSRCEGDRRGDRAAALGADCSTASAARPRSMSRRSRAPWRWSAG